MLAPLEEIRRLVRRCCEAAAKAASAIHFSLNESLEKHAEKYGRIKGGVALAREPQYAQIDTFSGFSAWATVLSVDLRGSSQRAVRVGAQNTFITMHTYLPPMIEIVNRVGGKVVGLRGDGLIATFGTTELNGSGTEVTKGVADLAVKSALRAGKAMLEAIDDAINPALREHGIPADLMIGVGIDAGQVVATNIGLLDASEITLYGPAVNHACKYGGGNMAVGVSKTVKDIYPTGSNGKVSFTRSATREGMWVVNFPKTMRMLG